MQRLFKTLNKIKMKIKESEATKQPDETVKSNGQKKLPKPNLPSDEKDDQRKQHHDQNEHQEGDLAPAIEDDDSLMQDDDEDETAGSERSTLKTKKGDSDSILNQSQK
jgi:hypothetical protein